MADELRHGYRGFVRSRPGDVVPGAEFLCQLPGWADHRSVIEMFENPIKNEVEIFLAHPEHPLHKFNRDKKCFEEVGR